MIWVTSYHPSIDSVYKTRYTHINIYINGHNICIYIYIYIYVTLLPSTEIVSLHHNSSVWLDTRDTSEAEIETRLIFRQSDMLHLNYRIFSVIDWISRYIYIYAYLPTGVLTSWEELCISVYVAANDSPLEWSTPGGRYIYKEGEREREREREWYVLSVTVILIGNGTGDPSSNPLFANALRKYVNLFLHTES